MKKGNCEVKAFTRWLVIQIRLMGSRQTKERQNVVASITMAYKTQNEYMLSVVLLRNGCLCFISLSLLVLCHHVNFM